MSLYPATYFGSWYGMGASLADAPAEPQDKAAEQDPLERDRFYASGPVLADFCGDAPPAGIDTWWRMRQHPTIVFAFSLATLPVCAGTRSAVLRNADAGGSPVPTGIGVQVTQTQDEKRRKLTEDVFETLWPDVLCGLEYLNFGHWTQEVIWGQRLGVTAPARFKSFPAGGVQLLKDKFNDFAGYKLGTEERDARYGFHAVCNGHLHDPLFGWPRARNAKDSWWRSVKSHQNGDRLERKASGIQMFLETVSGASFKDADGNAVVPTAMAKTLANAAAQGQVFTAPSTAFNKEAILSKPELAGVPAVRVTPIDWGNTGSAVAACIQRLGRLDVEMVRAYHRPEREGMEGEHGTKAEAGTHGAIGTLDSEGIAGDFIGQFNRQVVNRFLVTNFGPDAADGIYFKPAPLADPQQVFLQSIASALLASPTEGPQATANVDVRGLFKRVEMPMRPEGEVPKLPPVDTTPPEEQGNGDDSAGGRLRETEGANANGN